MKVGEAQKLYRAQRAEIIGQRKALTERKEALEKKMKTTFDPEQKNIYANEAASLELSIGTMDEKFDQNQEVLDRLMQQYWSVYSAESAKQQKESAADSAVEMSKIMEVARRIGKGAKVPATDEKKVMDYSMDLYLAAKNLAMLNKMNKKKKEEYDSLWGDEEEKKQYDPEGKAENAQTSIGAPEAIVPIDTAEAAEMTEA